MTVLHHTVAFHEAHHAAAALMQGMTPKCCRIDWPKDGVDGSVTLSLGDDPDPHKVRQALIACLLGSMAIGERWEDFPVDPDRVDPVARPDARLAAKLADALSFDLVDWHHAVWEADRLARSIEFRHLVVAIVDELERVEVLEREDLIRIRDATRNGETLCNT
jgi:hypothetical protein